MKTAARTMKSEAPPAAKAVEAPKPRLEQRPFVIQRKCGCAGGAGDACECDEKKVQRKAKGDALHDEVPREVQQTLAAPGSPLADDVREQMERRFDHDFRGVRVHVDERSTRAVNARAYTVGSHIVFDDHAGVREPRLLAHELTHVVQQRSGTFAAEHTISRPGDAHEREADAVAARVTSGADADVAAAAPAAPVIARQAEEEPQAEPPAAAETPQSAGASEAPPPPRIVDDDASDVGAGQMRKSEFLDALSAAACEVADAELARVGRSTEGCPYVERALAYYRRRTAAQVERAVRMYAEGASRATSARDYIPLVAARIGQGVARWASTGEISGIPPELAAQMPAMGLPEIIGAGLRAVGGFIGRLFGKAGGAAAVPAFDAGAASAAQLAGAPLDGGVRTRMEGAFGSSFAQVRVHTGGDAAGAAARIGARAYTVGSDIAFARGEYQPGTLVGDALIAHELAHVVQQRGATTLAGGNDAAYEEDADTAATGAMAAAWGGGRGTLRELARKAGPRLRSGLRLSRCSGGAQQTRATTAPGAAGATAAPPAAACPQGPIAPNAAATETGVTEPQLSGETFGETARPPANAQFGATLANGQWHFCLTQLAIPVRSAVRPDGYKIDVPSADAPVVTAATWGPIARDLRPTSEARNSSGSCLNERIVEPTIPRYSRRNTYWNRQLVVRHEAFHRTDWISYYKPQLITAEQTIQAHTLAATDATTAEAAVTREIVTLRRTMIAAYMTACRAYAPEKETRAYADGAPEYLALVRAIRARAQANNWNYPQAEIQAP